MNVPAYKEGTWFAMPLREGGYAIGVIARKAPRGGILLVYLFSLKREKIPSLAELSYLGVSDACKCIRVGNLSLKEGKWIILGNLENWRREAWPMIDFLGYNQHGPAWLVVYSDKNPNKVERHDPLPADITGLEGDMLYGSGAAEIMMTKLLA